MHTPGPWNVYRKPEATPTDLPWVAGQGGKPIAFMTHESIRYEDLDRSQANARLVASAPELVDALHDAAVAIEALLDAPDDENRRPHAKHLAERARALIAKATGSQA